MTMAHLKYYRVGPSWVLSCGARRLGLIHLSSPYWWKPIWQFPIALYYHLRLVLKSQ